LQTSISSVLNNSRAATVKRPDQLPLEKEFLCVDWNCILAFMFLEFDTRYDGMALRNGKDVDRGGVKLNFQMMRRRDDTSLLLLHVQGSLKTTVTKEHMLHFLQGDPPLRRDPRTYSIITQDDLRRGGWVVTLGLNHKPMDETFFPVYMDTVIYKKRGGVFWRSIDRITEIVREKLLQAFPASQADIKSTLKALNHMTIHETESGVDDLFTLDTRLDTLSTQEQQDIIELFNGSPTELSARDLLAFQRKFGGLIKEILVAVIDGTKMCVLYVKNPGRELNHMISKDYLEFSEIYICGC
jgi:hypothetical protein